MAQYFLDSPAVYFPEQSSKAFGPLQSSWPTATRTEFSLSPRSHENTPRPAVGFAQFNDGKSADEAIHNT
jgi:hypothetical protein